MACLHARVHLLSSDSFSLVLGMVQGIMATRLLSLAGYGLVAIVMGFASIYCEHISEQVKYVH